MTQERLQTFMRALPTVLLLAALVLGGWLAARWFWYFATPADDSGPVPPRTRVNLSAAANAVIQGHVFGVAATDTGVVISNLNIKLKGVFASTTDAPAFAI